MPLQLGVVLWLTFHVTDEVELANLTFADVLVIDPLILLLAMFTITP